MLINLLLCINNSVIFTNVDTENNLCSKEAYFYEPPITFNNNDNLNLDIKVLPLYLQNIINQGFFDKEPKYNPYAICTSSLYKKRDFDVPPSAARKCAKNYRWYKNTNYGK